MSNSGPVATRKLIEDLTARHFIAMWIYALQKNYKKTTMKLASGKSDRASRNLGYAFKNARESEDIVAGELRPELFVERLDTLCYIFKVRPRLSFHRRIYFSSTRGRRGVAKQENLYMSAE